MMEVSAGIIIWKKDGDYIKFFVCTPGGPAWSDKELWNFPKGHLEDGETPFEAAVREFKEETGVYPGSLNNRDYKYHGLIKQRSNKNVYVYSKEYSGEDFSDCHSNTFLWTDGKEYPEIGKYAWLTLDDIKEKGGIKAYYEIFSQIEETKMNSEAKEILTTINRDINSMIDDILYQRLHEKDNIDLINKNNSKMESLIVGIQQNVTYILERME